MGMAIGIIFVGMQLVFIALALLAIAWMGLECLLGEVPR